MQLYVRVCFVCEHLYFPIEEPRRLVEEDPHWFISCLLSVCGAGIMTSILYCPGITQVLQKYCRKTAIVLFNFCVKLA